MATWPEQRRWNRSLPNCKWNVQRVGVSIIYRQLNLTRRFLHAARQANDLLHDKLTELASQLIEAKDRIQAVEKLHANSNESLKQSSELKTSISWPLMTEGTPLLTDITILEQGKALGQTQKELSDTLRSCADLDATTVMLREECVALIYRLSWWEVWFISRVAKLNRYVHDKDEAVNLARSLEKKYVGSCPWFWILINAT